MKIVFILLIAGILGVAGYGILANNIMLEVQNLGYFGSITEIAGDPNDPNDGSIICVCQDPDNPQDFSVDNCQFGPGDPHEQADMLCHWETNPEEYPGDPSGSFGEGCQVLFWKQHNTSGPLSDEWPQGFDPDYLYNVIFQTNISITMENGDTNSDPTLLEALNADGEGINRLARESVAAILNAEKIGITYHYSIQEIIMYTQMAITTMDYSWAYKFAFYNQMGEGQMCPA
jgi:hypothetical protein